MVDAQEMADMPHCQLDPVITDAGLLHFCDRKDVSVALRNTGTVHSQYPVYNTLSKLSLTAYILHCRAQVIRHLFSSAPISSPSVIRRCR